MGKYIFQRPCTHHFAKSSGSCMTLHMNCYETIMRQLTAKHCHCTDWQCNSPDTSPHVYHNHLATVSRQCPVTLYLVTYVGWKTKRHLGSCHAFVMRH